MGASELHEPPRVVVQTVFVDVTFCYDQQHPAVCFVGFACFCGENLNFSIFQIRIWRPDSDSSRKMMAFGAGITRIRAQNDHF